MKRDMNKVMQLITQQLCHFNRNTNNIYLLAGLEDRVDVNDLNFWRLQSVETLKIFYGVANRIFGWYL